MKMSPNGLLITRHYEDCELTAYLCPAKVWTIGWGHTGSDVYPGLTITQSRADELLVEEDLAGCEADVRRLVKVFVTQFQFDALVDFDFNKGCPALAGSTLLRKVNAGDMKGAAEEFLKWIYGGDGSHNGIDDDRDGKIDEPGEKQRLRGLVRRAHSQRALFLGASGRDAIQIGLAAA